MTPTIAVVGSVNQDLMIGVDRLPQPGETILAHDLERRSGGKGANQAVAVAAAGSGCFLVGAVGDDSAGAELTAALTAARVDAGHVHTLSGVPTGTAVVLVDPRGENSIVVAAGANGAVTPELVRRSLATLPQLDAVLAQAELSVACIEAAASHAESLEVRFVLNLAPYVTVPASVLALCDPLVVNEIEAADLAAEQGLGSGGPQSSAEGLAGLCRSVIITVGGEGALYRRGDKGASIAAPRVTVVDTTGAGDAFVGAMVSNLAASGDLEAACRAGIEAGSRAVQHRGAQP